MSEAKSLATKLLEAQQSVDAVVKRGQNKGTGQGYNYATAADVIEVSRKALHDAGLIGFIREVQILDNRPITSGKGTAGMFAQVGVTLIIADAANPGLPEGPRENGGSGIGFTALGAGIDYPGDKAVYKAQTGATKYAYANALALPFADHDPEKDVGNEPGRLPEQKPEPGKALPDEKVDEIAKAVKASKIGFSDLSLLLGAVGADAPKAKRKDSIRKALAELTEERAEQFLAALEARTEPNEEGAA